MSASGQFRCNVFIAITALSFFPYLSECVAQERHVLELIQRWRAASASVKSAKIKCLHFKLQAHDPDLEDSADDDDPDDETRASIAVESSLSSEEFRILFHDKLLPLVGSQNEFVEMQREVKGFLSDTRKFDVVCSELTILQDGTTYKNDERFSKNRSIRLRTPKKNFFYESSLNLAGVDDLDLGETYSAQSLRELPDHLPDSAAKLFKLEAMSSGQSRLFSPGFEVIFNPETAAISHLATKDRASGLIRSEVWQARPNKYPGGVEMPEISAQINYYPTTTGESRLASADLFVIQEAEFNCEIPAADLTLPVPKGASVDDRSDPGRAERKSRHVKFKADVENLATFEFPAK